MAHVTSDLLSDELKIKSLFPKLQRETHCGRVPFPSDCARLKIGAHKETQCGSLMAPPHRGRDVAFSA